MRQRRFRVRGDDGTTYIDGIIETGGRVFTLWVPWGEDGNPTIRDQSHPDPVVLFGDVTITIEEFSDRSKP